MDFAVEVVGHTRSESSKDLGTAIGPGTVHLSIPAHWRSTPRPPQCPASEGIRLGRSCSGIRMNITAWIRCYFLEKLGHWGGWASFHDFLQQILSQRFRCTLGLCNPSTILWPPWPPGGHSQAAWCGGKAGHFQWLGCCSHTNQRGDLTALEVQVAPAMG